MLKELGRKMTYDDIIRRLIELAGNLKERGGA